MPDSTETLIYAEAQRMMSQQVADLDGLRARAGTLLSAASLVTAFLGGLALSGFRSAHPHVSLTSLAWSAIAAFIAVIVVAVILLLPLPWTFVLSPTILVEDHLDGPQRTDPGDLLRFLSTTVERHHTENAKLLRWLFFGFVCACAGLIYETVAWLLVLERG